MADLTFDITAQLGSLDALGASVRDAVLAAVDAMGEAALALPPPYGGPRGDAEGELEAGDLLSPPRFDGSVAAEDIAAVYDWLLSQRGDPVNGHCEDCLALAEGGPYTAATLPAMPRDGTTRCQQKCYCEVVERDPTWIGHEEELLTAATAVIEQHRAGVR